MTCFTLMSYKWHLKYLCAAVGSALTCMGVDPPFLYCSIFWYSTKNINTTHVWCIKLQVQAFPPPEPTHATMPGKWLAGRWNQISRYIFRCSPHHWWHQGKFPSKALNQDPLPVSADPDCEDMTILFKHKEYVTTTYMQIFNICNLLMPQTYITNIFFDGSLCVCSLTIYAHHFLGRPTPLHDDIFLLLSNAPSFWIIRSEFLLMTIIIIMIIIYII